MIELRCFEKKEGTQFKKNVPIESAEESFESRSCEVFQDSCVTVTHWCSSDSGIYKYFVTIFDKKRILAAENRSKLNVAFISFSFS